MRSCCFADVHVGWINRDITVNADLQQGCMLVVVESGQVCVFCFLVPWWRRHLAHPDRHGKTTLPSPWAKEEAFSVISIERGSRMSNEETHVFML